jgi:hypothetical protein
VVWPALHPSHYLSYARAAHRIALIPLLACQLLLKASTPPAPPSDRAEGPGHNIPLRVATAQQPWPMRHPVLAGRVVRPCQQRGWSAQPACGLAAGGAVVPGCLLWHVNVYRNSADIT